jgi:hypothetical protein
MGNRFLLIVMDAFHIGINVSDCLRAVIAARGMGYRAAVLGLPPSNMRHDAPMAESGIKPKFSVASLSIPVESIRRRGVSHHFLKETP